MKSFFKRWAFSFLLLIFTSALVITSYDCAGSSSSGDRDGDGKGNPKYAGDPKDPDQNYDPNDPNERN